MMSRALEQISAARIWVICQGASSKLRTSCLQGYSFQLVFQLVFPSYTLQLPSICVLQTAFMKFCSNNRGLVTLKCWDFWNISREIISALGAHGQTSLDVKKVNGMLTSNAKRIFCDCVTCFGTNKCCSNMGHPSGCFIKAPHFLLARLQLSTCFPISLSLIHLAASLYLCPADCFHEILFEQSGTCHSKMLGFLEHIKRDNVCSWGEWTYLTWWQEGQWNAD